MTLIMYDESQKSQSSQPTSERTKIDSNWMNTPLIYVETAEKESEEI